MRPLFLSVFLFILAACSSEAERAYTVNELIADKALLADVVSKCRQNPGELSNTPNCQNAAAAGFRARFESM
jgi:hypothetical protein